MSGAIRNTTSTPSPFSSETRERARFSGETHLRTCLIDIRNVPRYAVRYGFFFLAVLGALQIWAAKGDGPMPAFATLPFSAQLDPHRVSSARCMTRQTSDESRWEGLAPALAILQHANPEVARWVTSCHEQGRLVFMDRSDQVAGTDFLARFDLFQRKLKINAGLYAEPDGSVAAILCHEYRHARQGFPKVFHYALSFLFLKQGDASIVENDAVLYEREARCAIFDEADEALEAYMARLASR